MSENSKIKFFWGNSEIKKKTQKFKGKKIAQYFKNKNENSGNLKIK